jgi:hypothetical protein
LAGTLLGQLVIQAINQQHYFSNSVLDKPFTMQKPPAITLKAMLNENSIGLVLNVMVARDISPDAKPLV